MKYIDLPPLEELSFPKCTYRQASALRIPLRDAINKARAMPDHKMEEVLAVLHFALEHITQEIVYEEPEVDALDGVSDDPLDSLLGVA